MSLKNSNDTIGNRTRDLLKYMSASYNYTTITSFFFNTLQTFTDISCDHRANEARELINTVKHNKIYSSRQHLLRVSVATDHHQALNTTNLKFKMKCLYIYIYIKGQSKVIPQQAEVAQRVPRMLRPRIFLTYGGTWVVGRQPYAPAAFIPGEIPGTHFQGLNRPQGTWFRHGKNPQLHHRE